ncbi:hypothetical protein IFM89_002221 [Coptis chinensis]|uniref:Uncharacterized protein n=1 Tax=Coptis chinensis TaxID=261450 RepID=A0A835IIM8_9MAGN|nr:hypothetical protein IFM89_002221 [Coptis chinensis]
MARIAQKDLGLHKLVFEEDGLPDGTELANCLKVIKRGLEYIVFAAIARSALPNLKLMLVGLHVANLHDVIPPYEGGLTNTGLETDAMHMAEGRNGKYNLNTDGPRDVRGVGKLS